MGRKYAVDANILISCSRSIYPFDVAPAFWRQLIDNGQGRIILVDKIRDEILPSDDRLSRWLKENENFFVKKSSADPRVFESYSKIITSIKANNQYKESAKADFAESADSWLCAHASAYYYVIVTQEVYEPNVKRIVKIPNVCVEFDIAHLNLLQFVRELGIRFV